MKKIIILIILIIPVFGAVIACPVCEQNQPKPLQGITHGAGPQGNADYAIIIVGIIIVGVTLLYSLKYLLKPRENEPGHIKNIVVDERF